MSHKNLVRLFYAFFIGVLLLLSYLLSDMQSNTECKSNLVFITVHADGSIEKTYLQE
jgi:hypothetical protein